MASVERYEGLLRQAQTVQEKIDALCNLSWELRNSDTQRASATARALLALLEEHPHLDLYTYEAKALLTLAACKKRECNYDEAMNYAEHALKRYEEISDAAGIASAHNLMANTFYGKSDFQKALSHHLQSLRLRELAKDERGVAVSRFNIGQVYAQLADYREALNNLFEAGDAFERLNDRAARAKCLNYIGAVYTSLADYATALEYYHSSLSIQQELSDEQGAAETTNNIGLVYQDFGDQKRAEDFLSKSVHTFEKLNDKVNLAKSTHNLGNLHLTNGNRELASQFLQQSLSVSQSIGDKQECAATRTSLSTLMFKDGNYVEAASMLQKAIEDLESVGNQTLLATAVRQLAECFAKIGRQQDAIINFERATTLSQNLSLKREYFDALVAFATYLCDINDDARASSLLKKALSLQQEIFSDALQKNIAHMQVRFETQQAKLEAEALRKKNAELLDALSEVKRLQELIVMCAWTGKIKQGEKWIRIEEYLSNQLGVSVSHGISEEAANQVRAEFARLKKG